MKVLQYYTKGRQTMEYNKLDKRILISWRISRLIRLIIIAVVIGIPLFFLSKADFFQPFKHYAYMGAGLILLYKLFGLFIYPAVEYRQWGYIITDDRVEIRHGIFFVGNTIVPIVRIQHITVSQGPIIRKLGISVVNIHTASGQFSIEGISTDEADSIAENLRGKLYKRLDAQEN